MKNKKKLLLAIGAMGLVAIATGGVGTAAWLTATTAVNVKGNNIAYSVGNETSTVSIDDVQINITLAKQDDTDDVELSYKAPTTSGKDANGDDIAAGDILYGGMANGVTLREYIWDGDNSTHRLIGEYKATATFKGDTPTGARLEALKNNSYTFGVSAAGNVVILDVTDLSSATAEQMVAAAKDFVGDGETGSDEAVPEVTVAFDGDGAISSATLSNPYFMVRTNNPAGLEYTPKYEGEWSKDHGEYKVNDEVLYSDHYYLCKEAHSAGTLFSSDSTKWTDLGTSRVYNHSTEDIINVVESTEEAD